MGGRALLSLTALERGVPMGLSLLQTASSQDRDLGSDPLALTFQPGPSTEDIGVHPIRFVPKPVTLGQA